jgi:hypothetical protein
MATYDEAVQRYQQQVAAEAARQKQLAASQEQLKTSQANPTYASATQLEAEQGGAASKRLLNQITADPYKEALASVQDAEQSVNQYSTPIKVGNPPPSQPGKAWVWTGSSWIKPVMPNDGKKYTWDDDKGWVTDATSQAASIGQQERQSAYDLLYSQFKQYGLESLVAPLKDLVITGASPAEFTIKLRESEAYKKRFAANAQRVAKGLTALDEATYIAKEDAYQNLMRNYGLPESYWKVGPMGIQEGFQTLLANDVSAVELENRLQLAKDRVLNANPEIAIALKNFYPDITNGDILAYTLDPTNSLEKIKSKVAAAEVGGSAVRFGLTTNEADADYLARYGITKTQAEQGYNTISQLLPRSSQLADIYKQQPYNQATAEQEIFNVPGSTTAKQRRQQLVALETAAFKGSAGLSGGALSRDRSSSTGTYRETGAGSY